ncbi:hypothetical protein B0H34DRAFT_680927 [Crassisporium funariophilum]|nr:hypothetical protein B0H34DRAFT_680927 [Crassisporium funariophilum]
MAASGHRDDVSNLTIIDPEAEMLELLCAYQDEYDSNHERRQAAKAQVNFLAVSVYRRYRKEVSCQDRKGTAANLSLISTVPLDILFEVLEYLHPIDLWNLAHTNQSFLQLLEHESSTSAWKSCFDHHPDMPSIPLNVSGWRWGQLLFGVIVCEECGGTPAPADVTFYRRLCKACALNRYISDAGLDEMGSSISHHKDCLREASRIIQDPFMEDYGEDDCIVWPSYDIAEVDDIARELDAYNDYQAAGKALKSVEEFVASRLEFLSLHDQHTRKCIRWVEGLKRTDIDMKIDDLMAKIKARFKCMDFNKEDVDEATYDTGPLKRLIQLSGINRLSRKRFAKLRPHLERAIVEAGIARVKEKRKKIIEDRNEFLRDEYRAWIKTECLPSTGPYVPPVFEIRHFEAISNVINAEHDNELVTGDLDQAFKELPHLIQNWTISKMTQLASSLPSNQPATVEGSSMEGVEPDLLALSLATSVFNCLGSVMSSMRFGLGLIGWDGAGAHLRCGALERYWEKRLHFSQRGYDAATCLVELMESDPKTTRIWDMDQLDKRFICLTCPRKTVKGITGRGALPWRDCVYHFIDEGSKQSGHEAPYFSLLGSEAEADIKVREGPEPYLYEPAWACNHCPHHFRNNVSRKFAVNHVTETHNITRPIENLDFFYYAGMNRTYRTPLVFPEVNPREYACLRCAATKSRLYTEKALKPHLHDAHGLPVPVENVDWKRVQTILRSKLPPPVEANGNEGYENVLNVSAS